MKEFVNNIKNVISLDIIIYIGIALAVIIILTILMVVVKNKKARRHLDELEQLYHTLKGIPLAFKLNKAVALSRVNETMLETVEECRNDFDSIQEMLKECSIQLAEIDDLLYVHKAKSANKKMSVLEKDLHTCEADANRINTALDAVLEQENEQRIQINKLKEEFRLIKRKIDDQRSSYSQSYEYLEMEISNIEKMFSSFEEWMFASEFNKAADQQKEISESMEHLHELVDCLPSLYEQAKGVLPRKINDVGYNYAAKKNKGVYLEHLDVHKNLEVISDMLTNNLNKLRNGNPKGVQEDLEDCEKRIAQLADQIQKEDKAFDEVNDNIGSLFEQVKEVNQDLDDIIDLYNRVYERFGFENWTEKLSEANDKLHVLNEMKRSMEKLLLEKNIPYTTILIDFKELKQSTTCFHDEVNEMRQKLDNACSDEVHAKKQLIKMQVILNEIRVKMSKNRLPSVSQKYEDDLRKGELMLKNIRLILDNSPIDVKRLNNEVREAIDFIFSLYNSVNNLVGMAIMVENTIVFGNRYRSSFPEIDSELTRAELCFRNGQYTKALKIGIQCIEKMHPGAYNKLLASSSEDSVEVKKEATA